MVNIPITVGCIFHFPRKEDFYVVVASDPTMVLARRLRDGKQEHYLIDVLNQYATLVYTPDEVVPFDEMEEYKYKPGK